MSTKLLALAASTRHDSLNKRLLRIAVQMAEAAGAKVSVLDYATCNAPLYEGEPSGALPAGAQVLSDALRAHDGLLLAMPEYNWSIPAPLKNLIDWLSIDDSQPLKDRTALLMCASPSIRGGISGLQQLNVPLAHLGMLVYPQLIGIGDADSQIGEQSINRERDHVYLSDCVRDFVRVTTALKGH